ncbi:hypothetical protein FHS81_002728 [Pseudochelatococcus contaminans]|uniref:Serine protease n=1 Tax=Pseudochelatococcus contaminans TaxID=1538103 RepID=A0A7W5Z5K6_9HYPH|nr:hypothetical protein [Pseudochelatococcus contaminans]
MREYAAVFGYPLTGILTSSGNFTQGSVTALAGLRDDNRMLQISAPVQPGNSGGPLLDDAGNVVGVVVSKLNALKVAAATDDLAQNVNFAIKASVVQGFLEAQGIQLKIGAPRCRDAQAARHCGPSEIIFSFGRMRAVGQPPERLHPPLVCMACRLQPVC